MLTNSWKSVLQRQPSRSSSDEDTFKVVASPHRKTLECLHSTVITANVDIGVVKMSPSVKQFIKEYEHIERQERRRI